MRPVAVRPSRTLVALGAGLLLASAGCGEEPSAEERFKELQRAIVERDGQGVCDGLMTDIREQLEAEQPGADGTDACDRYGDRLRDAISDEQRDAFLERLEAGTTSVRDNGGGQVVVRFQSPGYKAVEVPMLREDGRWRAAINPLTASE